MGWAWSVFFLFRAEAVALNQIARPPKRKYGSNEQQEQLSERQGDDSQEHSVMQSYHPEQAC